jgi:dihydroxyacetone kinase
MGIHNEPGFAELRPFPPVGQLVDKLLSMLTSTSDPERSFVPFANDGSDEVVLLVNNLGGISELELGGVAGEGTHFTCLI